MTHDQQLIAGLFFPPLAQLERARSFYLCGSGFESSMADQRILNLLFSISNAMTMRIKLNSVYLTEV